MKSQNPVHILLTVIFTTTLACSSLTPGSSPIETTEPVQPQSPQIEEIIIQTGIDPNEPAQVPQYFLHTSHGHYLLYIYETGKLIYDGKEVYSGDLAGLYGDGMALSHNGTHYAHVAQSSEGADFNDLYVDGVKVKTAQYLSRPAVTDDGAQYFYTACNHAIGVFGICLFKDETDVFLHNPGILAFWISSDGNNYYASLRNFDDDGNFVESLVRNGEQVYKGTELAYKLFSPNGQHYAYVTSDANPGMQSLVVDGMVVLSSTALLLKQITDLGSYCIWDSAHKRVVINGREFPLTGDSQIGCYINDDASHSLIHDGDWFLDGKPAQLPELNPDDKVWDVEMMADIWYVYRLVK